MGRGIEVPELNGVTVASTGEKQSNESELGPPPVLKFIQVASTNVCSVHMNIRAHKDYMYHKGVRYYPSDIQTFLQPRR